MGSMRSGTLVIAAALGTLTFLCATRLTYASFLKALIKLYWVTVARGIQGRISRVGLMVISLHDRQ